MTEMTGAPCHRALAGAALAALLCGACSCPQHDVLVDDFESCTGTCGWSISGGSAKVVSTLLPGEHGLEIDGGATATKSITPAAIDTSYSLRMVADCPDGLSATVTATVPSTGDVSISVVLSIDTTLTSSGDPPDYSGATYVPLTGFINLPSGTMSASAHQVSLQPASSAPCTVDVIKLLSATPCTN
jgi:hypothetical protein